MENSQIVAPSFSQTFNGLDYKEHSHVIEQKHQSSDSTKTIRQIREENEVNMKYQNLKKMNKRSYSAEPSKFKNPLGKIVKPPQEETEEVQEYEQEKPSPRKSRRSHRKRFNKK
jgi:3-isopropylmalate dehydratase small subunit